MIHTMEKCRDFKSMISELIERNLRVACRRPYKGYKKFSGHAVGDVKRKISANFGWYNIPQWA